jgi:hypothetical protein
MTGLVLSSAALAEGVRTNATSTEQREPNSLPRQGALHREARELPGARRSVSHPLAGLPSRNKTADGVTRKNRVRRLAGEGEATGTGGRPPVSMRAERQRVACPTMAGQGRQWRTSSRGATPITRRLAPKAYCGRVRFPSPGRTLLPSDFTKGLTADTTTTGGQCEG